MSQPRFRVHIVERYNAVKHRFFKVTFTGDGIEYPVIRDDLIQVSSRIIRNLGNQLTAKLDYIIARDRPSLILAVALSLKLNVALKVAYKYDLNLPKKVPFIDPYIPNEPAYLYNLKTPCNVLLVDDEALTGNTMVESIVSLRKNRVNVIGAVSYVECLSLGAREKIEQTVVSYVSHIRYHLTKKNRQFISPGLLKQNLPLS